MSLMTQAQQQALDVGFPSLNWAAANVDPSEPPTLEQIRMMRLIMEGWLILYWEDTTNLPDGEPKDTWLGMLGASHDEMIAAGMAAVWP